MAVRAFVGLRSASFAAGGMALAFAMGVALPQQAAADVITFDLGETVEAGGLIQFDLNNDGFNDYEIEILTPNIDGPQSETFEVARIRGIFPEFNLEDIDRPLPVSASIEGDIPEDIAHEIFLENSESAFVRTFEAGDTVFNTFSDPAPTSGEALFYLDETGPFSEEGSTAFIGLQIINEFEQFVFGFAEITRGSITVGTIGFENNVNTGALIPGGGAAVPVPASIGFMALGAFGLAVAGWRRRKQG